MRGSVPALVLLSPLAAGCGPGLPGSSSTPRPSASAAAAGAPHLNGQACSVLTTADVQSVLGVPVNQLPMNSPPPGGGPGGSLISGCSYASAGGTSAGASLFLFRDMPIDFFGSVPGYQQVPGMGDRAFEQVPLLIGQKGHVTFQLIIVSTADDATKDRKLRAMGQV